MNLKAPMSIVLLAFAQAAHSAQPVPVKETLLYCAGKTWYSALSPNEFKTDAIVRITGHDTYMEIAAVGAGLSNQPPATISGIQSGGSIAINLAQSGHSRIEAMYNLNRYNGDLSVSTSSGDAHKEIFTGSCKPAEPLF